MARSKHSPTICSLWWTHTSSAYFPEFWTKSHWTKLQKYKVCPIPHSSWFCRKPQDRLNYKYADDELVQLKTRNAQHLHFMCKSKGFLLYLQCAYLNFWTLTPRSQTHSLLHIHINETCFHKALLCLPYVDTQEEKPVRVCEWKGGREGWD